MKARLIGIESPDVEDLATWRQSGTSYCIPLKILLGPEGEANEEIFSTMVCSAQWLAELVDREGVALGAHYLIMKQFDYTALTKFVEQFLGSVIADSWEQLAGKLSLRGHWEFESYKPFLTNPRTATRSYICKSGQVDE